MATVIAQVTTGMGGIGKTTLAIERWWAEAIALMEEVAAESERVPGGEHRDTVARRRVLQEGRAEVGE